MFDKVKTATFSFLHALFGIKIMTTAWDPKVLPPYAEPIGNYCQRLVAIKQGNGVAVPAAVGHLA